VHAPADDADIEPAPAGRRPPVHRPREIIGRLDAEPASDVVRAACRDHRRRGAPLGELLEHLAHGAVTTGDWAPLTPYSGLTTEVQHLLRYRLWLAALIFGTCNALFGVKSLWALGSPLSTDLFTLAFQAALRPGWWTESFVTCWWT